MKLNTERITEGSRFWDKVNALAKEAFPPEEYLAPAEIVKMAQNDNYDFLALTDDDKFIGFTVIKVYKDMTYLFFLAIDKDSRGKGYGSSAIEALKLKYPNKIHTVDFEMPDENAPNSSEREKRRNFYLRNGYNETGSFLTYLGVDYEVFYIGKEFIVENFKEMMKNIRVEGFDPKYFTK